MKVNDKRIKRIIFSIDKDDFNDDILDIMIKVGYIYYMKLNKIDTIGNINIYENTCILPWTESKVNIKFLNLLLDVGILDEDISYNHINELCGYIYHPKNDELSYSVYYNIMKVSAITLFTDKIKLLKYPALVSLVLFDFLHNNYPQDIKNCILLLYNDV